MEEKESIIAYIAFDDALSSENGKYKVGETYKIRGALIFCQIISVLGSSQWMQ